ncbi:MAG: nucleotidyltransferase family protein [Kangiellaceae bacterium]|nr:nucleotidyltransferase family protein [Kangiellaceae bacterium]MCW8999982.1 nucleotidyltransferase family protein [Kangiellaceae bacterium]MCW9017468.1 nucleotidyltransferase family protein [Kangiellaceae bacterium]
MDRARTDRKKIAAMVIAAGNSSRLGFAKQSIELSGQTLLSHSIKRVKGLVDYSICILGCDYENFHKDSNLADTTLVNKNWRTGMGSSIAYGVKHIETHAISFDGVLICLCDQWRLTTQDISNLVDKWNVNSSKIVACRYFEPKLNQTVNGAPAIFPREFFAQLIELKEQGARKIIKHNEHKVLSVDTKNAAFDVDTPQDYQEFLSQSFVQNEQLEKNYQT